MVCLGNQSCYKDITIIQTDIAENPVCSNNFCFTGTYLKRNLEVGFIDNFTFGLQRLTFEEAWQADFDILWNGIDGYKIVK